MASNSYQPDDLSDVVIDLIRVGVSGNGGGVRQIATRLLKSLPTDDADSDSMREKISEAILQTRQRPVFRSAEEASTLGVHPLVTRTTPNKEDLPPLLLPPDIQASVDSLISQWADPERLLAAGVGPANTILLRGAPGVGKTLMAKHIATALGFPLLSVNLPEVVSSLLGGTGRNLREALMAGWSHPCVLFLDEIDAVGKKRDDSYDIGELKRIVNVLILELDQWPSDRVLMAATNHPHLLDSALIRRFEMVLDVPLPGDEERELLLIRMIDEAEATTPLLRFAVKATAGSTLADVEKLVRSAVRRATLSDSPIDNALVAVIAADQATRGVDRDEMFRRASELTSLSNRALGKLFGVSHPTVAASIRRAEEADR